VIDFIDIWHSPLSLRAIFVSWG